MKGRSHARWQPSVSIAALPRTRMWVLLALLALAGALRTSAQSSENDPEASTIPVPRELDAEPLRGTPGEAGQGETAATVPPGDGGAVPGSDGLPLSDGQDLLAEARRLRAEGKPREAYSAYRLWLEGNPGHPQLAVVLDEAARWAPDALLAADLLGRYAEGLADPEQKEGFLLRQARLLLAVGRLEEVARLLSGPGASAERLYLRALAAFEQGDYEGSLDALRAASADPAASGTPALPAARDSALPGSGLELQGRVYLLMAQVFAVQGRVGEAESMYLLLQKRYGSSSLAPAALLEYARLLSSLGRGAEAEGLTGELTRRFPNSPEALLARSLAGDSAGGGNPAGVTYAATPLRLLPPGLLEADGEGGTSARGSASPPTAVQESSGAAGRAPLAQPAGPSKEPAPQALVQTGSFRDAENAHYMVRDLERAGFAAEVREKTLGGTVYYRVVIGPPMTGEEAQGLMLRLKVAGFEGFLLFPD